MSFTDDDLKKLKGCIDRETQRLAVGLMCHHFTSRGEGRTAGNGMRYFDLAALIARLEAAEKIVKRSAYIGGDGSTESYFSALAKLRDKWLKYKR